jgi:hypothetical protein
VLSGEVFDPITNTRRGLDPSAEVNVASVTFGKTGIEAPEVGVTPRVGWRGTMDRVRVAKPSAGIALMLVAGIAVALVPGILPTRASAAVQCALLTSENNVDSDDDGFTDYQECQGITPVTGTKFQLCPALPTPEQRMACVDPNSKDLFVIYAPATSNSLLGAGFNPFLSQSKYDVAFKGLTTLGITAHLITPAQAAADRTVSPNVSTQRAVQLSESLDTGGSILGSCTWGTPNGLDGCTVYSQRILNFINTTCGSLNVVTPGGAQSSKNDVFLAYAIHVSLHETGHTTGGATNVYNASYGGNHYQAANSPFTGGKGTRMEQYVTSSTKSSCKFYIPADFDASLDPLVVNLK